MQILNSLIPIFAVIGLGIALRHFQFLNESITQGFNRFAYFFALPAFLFYKLGGAPSVGDNANRIMLTMVVATVATGLLCWLVTWIVGINKRSQGALIQASFRGNLAFMALPLILFVTSDLNRQIRVDLESAVLVALPPIVILYNAGSVAVLAIFNESSETSFSWRRTIFNVATNPLLLACLAGLVFQVARIPIPTAIDRTCIVLGQSAFPLALLGIGSQLAVTKIGHQWNPIALASGFKCVVCPLIGWAAAVALGLQGPDLTAVLIMAAVPTAVSSFVLADQMNSDRELAASSVVICTAFSFLTLSIMLTWVPVNG